MEVNFCPFCDASQHKLVHLDSMFHCKECKRFFKIDEVTLKCIKCNKPNVGSSDFPAPNGDLVMQCGSCKKMFSSAELLKFNNITLSAE